MPPSAKEAIKQWKTLALLTPPSTSDRPPSFAPPPDDRLRNARSLLETWATAVRSTRNPDGGSHEGSKLADAAAEVWLDLLKRQQGIVGSNVLDGQALWDAQTLTIVLDALFLLHSDDEPILPLTNVSDLWWEGGPLKAALQLLVDVPCSSHLSHDVIASSRRLVSKAATAEIPDSSEGLGPLGVSLLRSCVDPAVDPCEGVEALADVGKARSRALLGEICKCLISSDEETSLALRILAAFMRLHCEKLQNSAQTGLVRALAMVLTRPSDLSLLATAGLLLACVVPFVISEIDTVLPWLLHSYARLASISLEDSGLQEPPKSPEDLQHNLALDDARSPPSPSQAVPLSSLRGAPGNSESSTESYLNALFSLFAVIYGLFPLNCAAFLSLPCEFLGQFELDKEDINLGDINEAVLKANTQGITKHFRLHPALVSPPIPLATERARVKAFQNADPAKVVAICEAYICFDPSPTAGDQPTSTREEGGPVHDDSTLSSAAAPSRPVRNDTLSAQLHTEIHLKKLHIERMGHLHREYVIESTNEAERQNLYNNLSILTSRVGAADSDLRHVRKEASESKAARSKLIDELTGKLKGLREEKNNWASEKRLLRDSLAEQEKLAHGLELELKRVGTRLLDVESQLKVAEPRLTMLEDYEKRLAKLTESLLLWDDDVGRIRSLEQNLAAAQDQLAKSGLLNQAIDADRLRLRNELESRQALALELEQRIKSLERSSAKSTTWAQQGLPSMQEMSSGAF